MDCPFCSEELPPPAPLRGTYSLEKVLGGRCSCGALYLLDETARAGGQAVMDLLYLLAYGDMDRALSLQTGRDVDIRQADWVPARGGERKAMAVRAGSRAKLWAARLLPALLPAERR